MIFLCDYLASDQMFVVIVALLHSEDTCFSLSLSFSYVETASRFCFISRFLTLVTLQAEQSMMTK